MREPEERVTVVKTGGGSGGVIAGFLLGSAAMIGVILLFAGGVFGDRSTTSDITLDMPDVSIETSTIQPDAPAVSEEPAAAEAPTDPQPAE